MVLITKKCFRLQQFLFVIIIRDFLAVTGRTLKDFPEECFTAKEIDDDTRSFENYNVPTSKADDLDLEKSWYRIMGKSANSLKQGFDKVPGSKLNMPNFCGTVYAGTLTGEHPTVEEGMVEMTVCFRGRFCFNQKTDICECQSKKTIYVRNCQNHFIYWLSPTNRNERYCTGRTTLTGAKVNKDGESQAVECRQHKKYVKSSRVWNEVSDVTCDQESGWYRFGELAGGQMASQCSVNTQPISRLAQPCGAAFRGWMIDRHPTLADGRRNTRVCFSYPDSCSSCEFYADIYVRNCGKFFVYHINAPPLCNGKYCGAPKGSSSVANDLAKPPMNRNTMCQMYNVLYEPSRLWSYTSPTETNCDARLYGYFRFGSKYTPWSVKEKCNKRDMNTVTHRCGTRYQGYMEFRHPTVSEGYVERVICFQDATVPCECQFTSVIGVRNCSGFYVYEIRSVPKCQARLCMVANGTDNVTINADKPPMYDIPVPGYTIVEKPKPTEEEGDDAVVTTTILCIIILIVLILIVIIILTVLYIAHPVIWPSREKKEVIEENRPVVRKELLVESCISHENETEIGEEVGNHMDHQYTSVPDAPLEEQESDIIKRSDLVPDTPPEERNDVQEDDIQKKPDSEDDMEEKVRNPHGEDEKSAESIEIGKIEDDIDDIMHDLDVTRSDIVNLLAGDTTV